MIDAVFISDLHLHPNEKLIVKRFTQFVRWAADNTAAVYILGDFFHVWPGDEALDSWSTMIAEQLAWLKQEGVVVYFMPGNRDFLLGPLFMEKAGVIELKEPAVIELDHIRVLLVHGDRYCTLDKGHMWLRRLTRNRLFSSLFLQLPYALRARLVSTVRNTSQNNRYKTAENMDVVPESMLSHMTQLNVFTVIHGHTHKPGLVIHQSQNQSYYQYVLSDWDDNPQVLCYHKSTGFYFNRVLR